MKQILQNKNGIALMMVLGVIAILTYLLADFTFATKINKIKSYNYQDKAQARLTAESGLNLALTNLKIYQEGRNKLETQANAKAAFPPDKLEAILTQPFIYPIPLSKNANIIQKTALADFEKENLLKGELTVSYAKVVGFLNPNTLRLAEKTLSTSQYEDQASAEEESDTSADGEEGKEGQKAATLINNKFVETLERLMKDKSDADEDFHQKYSNVSPADLVNEIKYYVNSPEKMNGQSMADVQARFEQKKITPKHARMNSIDEMYLLPSWNDDLVNLIKDRMTVHEVSMISLNDITAEDLKIIFPDINEIQIEEFFKYRDGDPVKKIAAKKFKSVEDFKNLVTGQLQITSDSDFNERISKLKEAGLSLDVAGKLFKVTSQGKFNNATVTLTAFIDLPVLEVPAPKKKKNPNPSSETSENDEESETPTPTPSPSDDKEKEKEETKPLELMAPRVIEIRLQ